MRGLYCTKKTIHEGTTRGGDYMVKGLYGEKPV